MIPVEQLQYGWDGDCFAASVASILELPLDCLPNLMPHKKITSDEQNDVLNDWLEERGIMYIEARLGKNIMKTVLRNTYHTIVGTSPRDVNLSHVVVGKGGEMIHDPHKDKTGIVGFPVYGLFIKIDPSK
jgi:hypothetical protein